MSLLQRLARHLPAPARPVIAAALSLLAGLLVALVFDYVLFRVGLPSKPFIYVSF